MILVMEDVMLFVSLVGCVAIFYFLLNRLTHVVKYRRSIQFESEIEEGEKIPRKAGFGLRQERNEAGRNRKHKHKRTGLRFGFPK